MRFWEKLISDKMHLICVIASIVAVVIVIYNGDIIDWGNFGSQANTGYAAVTSAVLSDAIVQRISEECNVPLDDVFETLTDEQVNTLNAIMQSIDTQDKWAITANLSGGDWDTLKELLPEAYYKQVEDIYEDVKQKVSK